VAKELVWNERNLKKFWNYWSGKEDAYFKTIGIDHNRKSIKKIKRDYQSNPNFYGAYTVNELESLNEKVVSDVVFSLETIEHVLDNKMNEYFLI